MKLVKAGEATATRRRMYFDVRDEGDGITPELGENGNQPQISIDGGAFANAGISTLVAIGFGRYYATVDADQLIAGREINGRYRRAGTTAETPAEDAFMIVNYDPFDLPDALGSVLADAHGDGDWTGKTISGSAPASALVAIGDAISAYVATDYNQSFEVLNYDPTDWTQVDFIIKANIDADGDDDSIIKLIKLAGAGDDGLLIRNGVEAPEPDAGELTIDTATPNQLGVTVDISAPGFDIRTSPDSEPFVYEIVVWMGAAKTIVAHGEFAARRPARRATAADD